MQLRRLLLVLVASLYVLSVSAQAQTGFLQSLYSSSGIQHANATYYYNIGSYGSCGFDQNLPAFVNNNQRGSPQGGISVGMGTGFYADGEICGLCALVAPAGNCPYCGTDPILNSFVAYVSNTGPTPDPNHIDIGELNFQGDGRFPITWQAFPCPVSGPCQWILNGAPNPYFLQVGLANTPYPIAAITVYDQTGYEIDIPRLSGTGLFQTGGHAFAFPIVFTAYDIFGNSYTDVFYNDAPQTCQQAPQNLSPNGPNVVGVGSGVGSGTPPPKVTPTVQNCYTCPSASDCSSNLHRITKKCESIGGTISRHTPVSICCQNVARTYSLRLLTTEGRCSLKDPAVTSNPEVRLCNAVKGTLTCSQKGSKAIYSCEKKK